MSWTIRVEKDSTDCEWKSVWKMVGSKPERFIGCAEPRNKGNECLEKNCPIKNIDPMKMRTMECEHQIGDLLNNLEAVINCTVDGVSLSRTNFSDDDRIEVHLNLRITKYEKE